MQGTERPAGGLACGAVCCGRRGRGGAAMVVVAALRAGASGTCSVGSIDRLVDRWVDGWMEGGGGWMRMHVLALGFSLV